MNAIQHHIGKNTTSQRTKTKVTTSTIRRIHRMDETAKRCERYTERQAKIRTDNRTSDGFLKCTFLPKLKETVYVFKLNWTFCNKSLRSI